MSLADSFFNCIFDFFFYYGFNLFESAVFFGFGLARREVDLHDTASWADLNAFATRLALFGVDVGEVASHLDGLERTGVEALLAADAADLATLHRYGTLVGIRTADINPAVVLAARTDFDDASRTRLGANAAADALVGVHYGKPRDVVDVHGVERTFLHAVA